MAIEQRNNNDRVQNTVGIYLGKVVNHLDTTFMGGLQVEIMRKTSSGSLQGETVVCKYASPFYGQTPYSGLTQNNDYKNTQKSYGFWAVPPDIGTQVIVVMPEGDFGNAFWIGCVPDTGMNFMTPGYAGTTYNSSDPSIAAPVGEYNKKVDGGDGKDVTQIVKPADTDKIEKLRESGLLEDHIRGSSTSSARREAPSMVFGISTPGPYDWDGPKHSYGPTTGSSIQAPFNRLGGSSFVMDDGDSSLFRKKPATEDKIEYANAESGDQSGDKKIPANELIRLRTRSGHQILLHNSEDLIYIAHGSGKSWIEMTANGKIEIYSEDSVSVNTDNDLNFNAGRDINLSAVENINIVADKNIKMHSLENFTTEIGNDYKITVKNDHTLSVEQNRKTIIKLDDNLKVDNDLTINVDGNSSLRTQFNLDLQQKELNSQSERDTNFTTSGGMHTIVSDRYMARVTGDAGIRAGRIALNSNGDIGIFAQRGLGIGGASNITASRPINQGNVSAVTPSYSRASLRYANAEEPNDFEDEDFAFYVKRLPQHEPWREHENLDPQKFIPDETRASEKERPEPDESEFKFPTIPDTFKK